MGCGECGGCGSAPKKKKPETKKKK